MTRDNVFSSVDCCGSEKSQLYSVGSEKKQVLV